MKKFFIGFLLAFSIFLVPRSVSAADFVFPDEPVIGGFPSGLTADDVASAIYDNDSLSALGYSSDNSYFFVNYNSYDSSYTVYVVFVDDINFDVIGKNFFGGQYVQFPLAIFSKGAQSVAYSVSGLSNCTFTSFTSVPSGNMTSFGICQPSSVSSSYVDYMAGSFYYDSNYGFYNTFELDYRRGFCFGTFYIPPYEDDYLTGFVTGFDYSTEAFVQWLIDTGKYQELPAYIGISKLTSFIDFYKNWGSSNKLFVVKIVDWFMHFNIGAQTLENRNILKSTIDRLYQEYLNSSYVVFKSNSANQVHHRNNINTKTDDSDLTLVTDDPNDDTITSILRDILRGVIAIPTSIYNNSQAIIAKLDSLNWTVNISNDGGASSGTDLNPVLNKMDAIIEALGSDTVSVEIDQTTKDDTDDFFDDWNLQFTTALNNKFPVASQLRTFFTGFFERCGIDADSDGEVYQYYNPGVLTASSVLRSAGTASEDDIVSDFLGQFDNSDPAFLDDASFHGVPDLSVSVGGHSVSIIDFRVYAKYRDKIHFIISFVIWTLYLLHLYKALPSIIGQVADVATKTSEL